MASVTVLYFAMLRERLGRDGEAMDVVDGVDATAFLEQLAARMPAVASILRRCRVAVGNDFVSGPLRLRDGCEIALIPPVSGG